mgnify:CR=1 FL=1
MAIGMTYEQYWYDDPLLVRVFYKAEKLKQDHEDEKAWLYGLYMLNALNATVGNMFRKQGQAPAEYPKEPFSVTQEREKKERREQTEQEKEQEALWAEAWMSSFVQAGKHWGKDKQ